MKTHYVTEPPGKNWLVRAHRTFVTRALCGVKNWTSASERIESVTCKRCLKALNGPDPEASR